MKDEEELKKQARRKRLTGLPLRLAGGVFGVLALGALVNFVIIPFDGWNREKRLAQAQNQPDLFDLRIKGNKRSKIYHYPACPNYHDIAERNTVWFRTPDEAEAAGFRRTQNC